MRVAGIIAEYDPFHAGHAWQIGQLRQQGFDRIVICMSSWAVQRGGIPILPPLVRAQAALEAGADLVIALPAPYACRSAEGFAAAGVGLLNALGCVDTLAFGAENPSAPRLMQMARLLLDGALQGELRRWRDLGVAPGTAPVDHCELTVLLRIDSPFWRRFPYGLNQVYAVDSQGNLFTAPDGGRADGDMLLWTSTYVETTMPAWTKGVAVIPDMSTAEPWSPQWVELRLPEEIGDFTYRLELDYREVTP